MTRKELMNDYWTYYLMLEKKFVAALEYVELSDKNYGAFSNQFASMIQSIGAELDSFFKVYCGFMPTDRKNIADYATSILTSYPVIKTQTVLVKDKNIKLIPFSGWDAAQAAQSLAWWQAFDNIKHSRVANAESASLKNCLNILAALFLLEMKELSIITDGKHEPDFPDYPSELFLLENWNRRWIPMSEMSAEILGTTSD